MANNYNYINIVNALNQQTGGMYNYTFPVVDNENFNAMAGVFMQLPSTIKNAYIDNLRNIIANTLVKKVYRASNPFKFLYSNDTNLTAEGTQYVQEVAIDQFIPLAYEIESTPDDFFSKNAPKVKLQYLCNVIRKKYVVTINQFTVQPALQSVQQFGDFWTKNIERMYSDMEEDDKEEIMQAFASVIKGGNMYIMPVRRPTDSNSSINFSAVLETLTRDLSFKRRRQWNLQHLSTKTNIDDTVLCIAGDVTATQNKYNLAWALNHTFLQLMEKGQMITVDSDGIADNTVYAMLFDKDYARICNVSGFPLMKHWENGDNLQEKYWLHNWKLLNFSYSSNAIAFADPEKVGVQDFTLKPRSTTVKKGKYVEFDIPDVTPVPGKICDAFVTYEILPNSNVTGKKTTIDKWSGALYVDEKETTGTINIKATHHLDPAKTKTVAITVQ